MSITPGEQPAQGPACTLVDVESAGIGWLVRNRLPLGAVSLIVGKADALALATRLAAAVSRGERPADGPPGAVLWVDRAPRRRLGLPPPQADVDRLAELRAAGADLHLVAVQREEQALSKHGQGARRRIARRAQELQARLVILEVRRAPAPRTLLLCARDVAEATDAAVVLIAPARFPGPRCAYKGSGAVLWQDWTADAGPLVVNPLAPLASEASAGR